jgi:hypothetical protein
VWMPFRGNVLPSLSHLNAIPSRLLQIFVSLLGVGVALEGLDVEVCSPSDGKVAFSAKF